jgi:peptidoglycan/LPS O-acetylase OafA/YrhL
MFVVISIQAVFQKPRSSRSRRFETATLKRLFPFFGIYLLLLLLLPGAMERNTFTVKPGLVKSIRMIEFMAAFAILGYMIAEMRGRKDDSPFPGLCLAFGISSALLLLILFIQETSPVTWKVVQHTVPLVAAAL